TENLREKTKKGSLLWVLDKTNTAMGGRQLRRWIEQPLVNKNSLYTCFYFPLRMKSRYRFLV
ncbi:hypothetical protein, partial [Clostridium sporogenes]|uniref:hypothetical protein n=1 Tax=Clostridium sporogenes TaxID=1509 RepID=UPI00384488D8|nr:hypothetical protein [Clostridium sporogenes]